MSKKYKTMSQTNFLAFCIGQDPGFMVGNHHRKIAKKLEKIASGECKRLIINMPPRHGKSHMCNYLFPLWYMGKYPKKSIFSVSYSQELATDFGRKIRNHISQDSYKNVFPEVSLATDSQSASKFSTNQGGDYFAVGAGGTLTGRGGDLIIMDDMIKGAAEARSRTSRNNLREWYSSILRPRLMSEGSIVLIMTRWSVDDIAGWLMEKDGGEWEVISLPALDENDEPLWPEKFSLENLLSVKREVGSSVFNSLYQQRPTPEDGMFIKKDWLKFYDQKPEIDEIVISWDTTFKDGDSSDYCVGCVLGRSKNDQRIYLLEVMRSKMDFQKTRENMRLLSAKYRGATTVIEESANGYALLQSLKNEIPNLIGVKVTDSKESRIYAISPMIEAGQVLFPNPQFDTTIQECLDELLSFNKGKHDDFCDSLSQGLLRMREQEAPRWIKDLVEMSEEELFNLQYGRTKPLSIKQLMWPDYFQDED